MKKRILSLALAMLLAASLLTWPVQADAAYSSDYGWPDMPGDVAFRVTQHDSELTRLIVGETYQLQVWLQNIGPYSMSIPIGWDPTVVELVDPKTGEPISSGKKADGEVTGFRAGSKCYETGFDMLTFRPLYWNGRPVFTRNEDDEEGGYPYLSANNGYYAIFFYVSSPNPPAQAQLVAELNFKVLASGDPFFHVASWRDGFGCYDQAEPDGLSVIVPNGDEGAMEVIYGVDIYCTKARALTREENEEEMRIPMDVTQLPITDGSGSASRPSQPTISVTVEAELVAAKHLACFPYTTAAETKAVIKNVGGVVTPRSDYILPISLISDILNDPMSSSKRSILVRMPDEIIDKDEYALVFDLSNIDDMANNGLLMLYVETPWAFVGINTALLANQTPDNAQARLSMRSTNAGLKLGFVVDGKEVKGLSGMALRLILPYDSATVDAGSLPIPCAGGVYPNSGDLPMSLWKADEEPKAMIFLTPVFATYRTKVCPEQSFDDLETSAWAEPYINELAQRQIVNGVGDNKFSPESSVTREQFAKMLVCALGTYQVTTDGAFTDVPADNVFYPYVSSASAAGLVYGTGDGRFGRGQTITRQDLSVMAYRAVQQMGITLPATRAAETFADDDQIADYAKEAVYAMYSAGIINGMGEGMFAPKWEATRAQASKIICDVLHQALKLL